MSYQQDFNPMNYEQEAQLDELSRIFEALHNRATAPGSKPDHASRQHYGGALYGLMHARKILCGDTEALDHLRETEFQFQEGKQ